MEIAKIGADVAGVCRVFADEENAYGDCGGPSPQLSDNAGAGQPHHHGGDGFQPLRCTSTKQAAGVPDRLPLVMSDVVIVDGRNREDDPEWLLLDALNATMRKPTSDH